MRENPTHSPWADALELWWQTLEPLIPQNNHDVFIKFIEQSKNYFYLNEEIMRVVQALSGMAPTSEDWQQSWNQLIPELQTHFINRFKNEKNPSHFGEWPSYNWAWMGKNFFTLPDEFWQSFKGQVDPEKPNKKIEQLLSVLSSGLTPKEQEQILEGGKLWTAYQKSLEEYAILFRKMGQHTIELLHKRLIDLSKKNQQINKLRDFYDLLIECGEEAYAQFVNTEEYAEINAHFINTLMAWKQYERKNINDILNRLNIPTHSELDSITDNLRQMHQEMKMLLTESHEATIRELQQEIKLLRAELEIVKNNTKKSTRSTTTRTTKKNSLKKTTSQKATSPHDKSPEKTTNTQRTKEKDRND